MENNIIKRDIKIDILKAIGIFCVVAGHTGSKFTTWFYTFHLPIFFFVSGFLRYGKKNIPLPKFISNRAKTSIIPYVIFWIISVLYVYIYWFVMYKQMPDMLTIEDLKGLLLGGEWLAKHTNNFPIWYLQFYFVASIVFELLIRNSKKITKVLCFALLFFITTPLQKLLPGRPIFHINALPAALFFMFFGYFVKELITNKKLDNIKSNFPIGIVLFTIGWGLSVRHYGNIANIGGYSYLLGAMALIMSFYIISEKLINKKCIIYVGKNTLFILGLHCLVRDICSNLTNFMFKKMNFNCEFVENIVLVILIIIVCCGCAEIYKLVKQTIINMINKNKKITE